MATYRNGIETRDALYSSARKNFAANGYFNTSIKDIVTDVNSKLGLFTYYFESKESLALEIFYELQEAVYTAMYRSEHVAKVRDNVLVMDMARTRVWLSLLAQCPHIARFAGEVSATNAHLAHNVECCNAFYKSLRQNQPALLDSTHLFDRDHGTMTATLLAGMLMQFSHDFSSLRFEAPLDVVIDRFFTVYYGLCVSDAAQLKEAIQQSHEATEDVHLTVDECFHVTYR